MLVDYFGSNGKVLNTSERPLIKKIVRILRVDMMYRGPYMILEEG